MSNEVIHEIRVVETEDGYTIEMKGDKEALREMIFSARGLNLYGQRMWGGPGQHRRGGRHHRGHHEHGHHNKQGRRGGGRGRWRERMREHLREQMDDQNAPGYDLGPWLETDSSTDETTAL